MTKKESAFSDLPEDRQQEIRQTLELVQLIAGNAFLARTVREMAESFQEWLEVKDKHPNFTWGMLIFFEHIEFKYLDPQRIKKDLLRLKIDLREIECSLSLLEDLTKERGWPSSEESAALYKMLRRKLNELKRQLEECEE